MQLRSRASVSEAARTRVTGRVASAVLRAPPAAQLMNVRRGKLEGLQLFVISMVSGKSVCTRLGSNLLANRSVHSVVRRITPNGFSALTRLRTGNLRDPNGPQVTFALEWFIAELAAARSVVTGRASRTPTGMARSNGEMSRRKQRHQTPGERSGRFGAFQGIFGEAARKQIAHRVGKIFLGQLGTQTGTVSSSC